MLMQVSRRKAHNGDMETSNEIGKLSKALKAFQKDVEPIGRDAKANYGRYATLGAILKAIKEPLAHNGLAFTQVVEGDNLTTMIMHESGEWIRGTAALKLDKQTAQGQGSAITYARRYNLSAALGLDTDEDDDGNSAETPRQARQEPATAKKQTSTGKDPETQIKAAKDRIATLVDKTYGKPTVTGRDELKKWYGDKVFDATGLSLPLAGTLDEFEQIAEALAEVEIEK